MSEMNGKLRALLARPLVVAMLSAGVGAAVVVCLLGIPKLWSAEAAGWASAVGTTLAAVVALYVGLAPHRATRADHVARARAISVIVYGRLTRQLLDLESVRLVCIRSDVDDVLFAIAIEHMSVDPAFSDPLLPYFDVIDNEITSSLAAAVADLEAAKGLLRVSEDLGAVQAPRIASILDAANQSLRRTRTLLAPFAKGVGPASEDDVDVPAQKMANGMADLARAAREMRGGMQILG